jgi:hypothetical protein
MPRRLSSPRARVGYGLVAVPSPEPLPGSNPCTCTGSLAPIGWLAGSVGGLSWPLGVSELEDGGGSEKVPLPPPWVAGSAPDELGEVVVVVVLLLGSVALVWRWWCLAAVVEFAPECWIGGVTGCGVLGAMATGAGAGAWTAAAAGAL